MTKKNKTRHRLNELLVELFNYILYIEEKNLKDRGVTLTMSEVHLLESVSKAKNNNVTSIASKMMITKGTFSINASRLEAKGYLRKYRDENDARVVRMEITDKAKEVLKIHDKFHEVLID
ncbi:MAG: MarR family transcriptional regulator, partial [Erysipelotrichaceae bacterium]